MIQEFTGNVYVLVKIHLKKLDNSIHFQVLLFLLLDWLLIRRNALGSSPLCLSFRRHPSGKFGYSYSSGGCGMGGPDWTGAQGGYAGGSLGPGTGGQGAFGHHKRSTNMILSV